MEPDAKLATELVGLSDRDAYLRAASELLGKLFPSNHVVWNALDAQAGSAEVIGFPKSDYLDLSRKLLAVVGDHPAVLSYLADMSSGMWPPRRLSDLSSDLDLYQTQTYKIVLQPYEGNRQLTILAARLAVDSARCWTLNRLNSDYTDNDIELARFIQPVLRLLDTAYASQDDTAIAGGNAAEKYELTAREQQILGLLAKGLTGVAIGHHLGVSPRTVAKHLEHSYAKLGCTNRINALRRIKGQ